MPKEKTLFEKYYTETDSEWESVKMPLTENSIKRKFEAAYDSAADQIIDANLLLNKLRRDFKNFNVNEILDAKLTIVSLEEDMEMLKDEYRLMFGVELPIRKS